MTRTLARMKFSSKEMLDQHPDLYSLTKLKLRLIIASLLMVELGKKFQ
jgi:hypothetical protein